MLVLLNNDPVVVLPLHQDHYVQEPQLCVIVWREEYLSMLSCMLRTIYSAVMMMLPVQEAMFALLSSFYAWCFFIRPCT